MTEQKTNVRPYAIALAVLSCMARLLPHPPNFTPVGGSSLFAGARVNGWYAFLLPLLVMAVTDPLVGGYTFATPFIYAAFLVNVLIGRSLRSTNNPMKIGAAAFACSLQFFVISNLADFVQLYPHTVQGLANCYLQALPFFGRTLAGDLTYTAIIFGLHFALTRTIARQERVLATA